jgi:uncharacterized protein YabE (DUF348 family)
VAAVAGGGVLLAGAVGAVAYASATPVALSVDGETRDFRTHGDTVAEVLADEGVVVGARDQVTPALATEVQDGDVIAVRYARPVTVVVDGVERTEYVYSENVASALTAMGLHDSRMVVSVSRSMSIGRDGTAFAVSLPKSVTLTIDGKDTKLVTTSSDVEALLAERRVRLGPKDTVSPKLTDSLKDGSRVTVVRTLTSQKTVEVKVPYETVRRADDDLYEGQSRVERAGVAGRAKEKVQITTVGGKETDRKVLDRTVTRKPVTKIVLVGTRERPVVSRSSGSSSGGGGVWDRLAACESGGNWSINTGNGYYGGLQFSLSTWRSFGGSGYPHQASKGEQIAVATKLRDASGGYGAWPACSRKLGLPR